MSINPSITTPVTATTTTPMAPAPYLSDSIIASSNRYNDIGPYSSSVYHADPLKWGSVLPWEFPQHASKEVEEAFLRQWFSETEIHMQGGANGSGTGFRFLKQVWMTNAGWNAYHRIPSIAAWWLAQPENKGVLQDAAMVEHLCKPDVVPETLFKEAEVEMYGSKLLRWAVKHIQNFAHVHQCKQKQGVQESPAQSIDAMTAESSENSAEACRSQLSVPVSTFTPSPETDRMSSALPKSASSSASPNPGLPTNATPNYITRTFSDRCQQEHNAPSLGRKRGATAATRIYGGSVEGTESRHSSSHFDSSPHVQGNPLFDPVSLNDQASPTHMLPPHYTRGRPGNRLGELAPGGHAGTGQRYNHHSPYPSTTPIQLAIQLSSTQQHPMMMQPWDYSSNMTSEVVPFDAQYNRRNFSDEPPYMGFEGHTGRRGNGRDGMASRGGSLRGVNHRGGRGRHGSLKGSIKDVTAFTNPAAEQTNNQPLNDFPGHRRGFGNKQRRNSAFDEANWRSGSDHPQVHVSNHDATDSSDQHSIAQHLPMMPMPSVLQEKQGRYLRYTGHQDLNFQPKASQPMWSEFPGNGPAVQNANVPRDHLVTRDFIGDRRTDVIKLVMFDVQPTIPEAELVEFFRKAEIHNVEVQHLKRGPTDQCITFVHCQNHGDAQRCLRLRGQLFAGMHVRIEVSKEFWDPDFHGQRRFGRVAPPSRVENSFRPIRGTAFVPDNRKSNNMQERLPPGMMMPHFDPYRYPSGGQAYNQFSATGPQDMSRHDSAQDGYQTSRLGAANSQHVASLPFQQITDQTSLATSGQSKDNTPSASGNTSPKRKKKGKKNTLGRTSKPLLNDNTLEAANAAAAHAGFEATIGKEIPVTATNKPVDNSPEQQTIVEVPDFSLDEQSKNSVPRAPVVESTGVRAMDASDLPDANANDKQSSQLQHDNDPEPADASQELEGTMKKQESRKQHDSTTDKKQQNVVDPYHANKLSDTETITPCLSASELLGIASHDDVETGSEDIKDSEAEDGTQGTPSSTTIATDPVADGVTKLQALDLSALSSDSNLVITLTLPNQSTEETFDSTEATAQKKTQPPCQTLVIADIGNQAIVSPTPAGVYHTAPSTPAIPLPESPVEPRDSRPTTSAKKLEKPKGPSQTESFSMFGRKQQTKKKPRAKGKASIRGKPKEMTTDDDKVSGGTTRLASGSMTPMPIDEHPYESQVSSAECNATKEQVPVVAAKPECLSAVDSSKKDAHIDNLQLTNKASPTSSNPSPTKRRGTLGGLLHLFGTTASSSQPLHEDINPPLSVEKRMLTDVKNQTLSPGQVPTSANFDFSVSHSGVVTTNTVATNEFEDNAALQHSSNEPEQSVNPASAGLGIIAGEGDQAAGNVPKKKKKKKSKNKKRSASIMDHDQTVDADDEADVEVVNRAFPPPTHSTILSFGPTSEAHSQDEAQSDGSSQTVGRPTPPDSPDTEVMTPTQRKIAAAQSETKHHLVEGRKPPNIHKRRVSSRTTSDQPETQSNTTTTLVLPSNTNITQNTNHTEDEGTTLFISTVPNLNSNADTQLILIQQSGSDDDSTIDESSVSGSTRRGTPAPSSDEAMVAVENDGMIDLDGESSEDARL